MLEEIEHCDKEGAPISRADMIELIINSVRYSQQRATQLIDVYTDRLWKVETQRRSDGLLDDVLVPARRRQ